MDTDVRKLRTATNDNDATFTHRDRPCLVVGIGSRAHDEDASAL